MGVTVITDAVWPVVHEYCEALDNAVSVTAVELQAVLLDTESATVGSGTTVTVFTPLVLQPHG